MIRFVLASAVLVFALPALADETARDPRVEALLKELPSDAELDKAIADMPDMNRMMTGLLAIMKDEATQAKFKAIGERLARQMDDKDFKSAEGELPDFNALMADMMSLMGDKALIGDMAELGFEIEDEMKALADEAGVEAENRPSTSQ